MISKTVMFNCEQVLPMKAVVVMIQKASSYKSSLWIARGERRANAKSLLGVMSLGIDCNTEIVVTAEGEDEQEAIDSITSFLQNPQV